MKILLTGMTSGHGANSEDLSFFNLLHTYLSAKAEVYRLPPKSDWTAEYLDQFDLIFFGLTPPTSLSANRAYPGLKALNKIFYWTKTRIVLDFPQPWQYKTSIDASVKNPVNIFKDFYANRVDWEKAKSTEYRNEIVQCLNKLSDSEEVWPKCVYPTLPWHKKHVTDRVLSFARAEEFIAINLDYLALQNRISNQEKEGVWLTNGLKTSWTTLISKSVYKEIYPIKTSPKTSQQVISDKLSRAFGVLIPPVDRKVGTWWNTTYPMALEAGAPIVTAWQETQDFDSSWNWLAYQIEEMDSDSRDEISISQYTSYLTWVLSQRGGLDVLMNTDKIETISERA